MKVKKIEILVDKINNVVEGENLVSKPEISFVIFHYEHMDPDKGTTIKTKRHSYHKEPIFGAF